MLDFVTLMVIFCVLLVIYVFFVKDSSKTRSTNSDQIRNCNYPFSISNPNFPPKTFYFNNHNGQSALGNGQPYNCSYPYSNRNLGERNIYRSYEFNAYKSPMKGQLEKDEYTEVINNTIMKNNKELFIKKKPQENDKAYRTNEFIFKSVY